MLLTLERTTSPVQNIISQMAWDRIYDVSPPCHGNDQHEIVKDMLQHLQMSTPGGSRDSKKHSRRDWKEIRNLFRRFCCCFPTPRTKDTASSLLPSDPKVLLSHPRSIHTDKFHVPVEDSLALSEGLRSFCLL